MNKKSTTQNGKNGGLLDGPSHDNGGIPVVVKSTNEPIEVEGGEIIINKEASKKHCKLLSKINQSAGNGIEIPCDCEDCENYTPGKAKQGAKIIDGGEISKAVDYKLIQLGFEYNKFNYRFGKLINENTYINAYYDKRKSQYKISGISKFKTPLGKNSVGINFQFDNEKDFIDKINEYLSKSSKSDTNKLYKQAKKGRFIYPKKQPKPITSTKNEQTTITFEDTIIEIEQKYMEGADRILTMADGQEKVTQATRDALLEWILEPDNNTKVVIAFSGGKDSVAMVLHAFNLGIKPEQIELWHHDVDGEGEKLFDWNCTPSYCQAFANHFNLPLLFSYRLGGIAREIQRNKETSQDVYFQKEAFGQFFVAKSIQRADFINSKNMFPQVATRLDKRWCSASAKIEVMSKAINNNERFDKGNFVIMTGERRAESKGRSGYNEIEPYANMSQNRRAITWRPIIDFSEKEVWDLMKSKKIQPHPCYELGWGRCSCQLCIFSDGATWRSLQQIAPEKIDRIEELEKQNAERNSKAPTLYAKNQKSIGIKEYIESCREPKERDETQPINEKTKKHPYKKYPKGHVQPLVKSFIKKDNALWWLHEAQGKFTSPIIVEGEWNYPQGAFSDKQCGAN